MASSIFKSGIPNPKTGNFDSYSQNDDNFANTRNDEYADIAATNPYAESKYGSLGLWDRLGNLIGFNTAEDKYNTERATLAAQYDAQIESLKFENEYNSPSAQASRMREAGQNPDLLGTSGVAGAAEMTEPVGIPTANDGSANMAAFTGFTNMLKEGCLGAIGFATQLQGYEAGEIANASSIVDLFSKTKEFAFSNVFDFFTGFDKGNSKYGFINPSGVIVDNDLFPRNMFTRSKLNRYFNSVSRDIQDSLKSESGKQELWNKIIKSKMENGRLLSEPGYNDDVFEISKFYTKYSKKYFDLKMKFLDVKSKEADASAAQADYDTKYFGALDAGDAAGNVNAQNLYNKTVVNGLDPQSDADAKNAGFISDKAVADFKAKLDSIYGQMTGELYDLAENKNKKWASLYLMSMYMNNVGNNSPHGFNMGFSGDSSFGNFTDKRSFNLGF